LVALCKGLLALVVSRVCCKTQSEPFFKTSPEYNPDLKKSELLHVQ